MTEYATSPETKRRGHLDGVRTLENNILQQLMSGEELQTDIFNNVLKPSSADFINQARELYAEFEAAYTAVVGKTFSGESSGDTPAATPEKRLAHFKFVAGATQRAITPISALTGASFIAEVEHFLREPAYLDSPSLDEREPQDPDNLEELLAPVQNYLKDTHTKVFESEIKHLVPDELHNGIEASVSIGKLKLGKGILLKMLESIREKDGDAAHRKAIAELPNKLRLSYNDSVSLSDLSENALAALDDSERTTVEGQTTENASSTTFLEQTSTNRDRNYIDPLRAAVLTYCTLRQHDYSPKEAIAGLLHNVGVIGQLTERVLDAVPSSPKSNDTRHSLAALLEATNYISVQEKNGTAITYLHTPPRPDALSPVKDPEPKDADDRSKGPTDADYRKDKRKRSVGGGCPMRQRIDQCPPNIRYLLSELKSFGITAPIVREDGSIRGGSLAAVISIMAAEECGIFKRLEENPHFQEVIERTPELAQDYYELQAAERSIEV